MKIKILPFVFLLYLGCSSSKDLTTSQDYRADMREFVISISEYAKARNSSFAIIPQNGIELVTDSGSANGNPELAYLNAIDGNGQEGLLYGYTGDDNATPDEVTTYLSSLLEVSQEKGNSIFIIDYCTTATKVSESYENNYDLGFIPFAASERNLTTVPNYSNDIDRTNSDDISVLSDAQNFLFFLNYEDFQTKESVINAILETDYDVVFIDLFFNDGTTFTAEQVEQLKTKDNGGKRLVCSYMSIGEAEDYRYYWNSDWNVEEPEWLDSENENWPGNYKVKYWNTDWQNIILGSEDSYLDKIITTGFDGVYMDIIDGFQYFENK